MRKFRVWVSTNRVGSKVEDTFEIEDPKATQEDIEVEAREIMYNMIEWSFEEVKKT